MRVVFEINVSKASSEEIILVIDKKLHGEEATLFYTTIIKCLCPIILRPFLTRLDKVSFLSTFIAT